MSIANEPIFQWLAQFAFQPNIVYFAIVGMMLISAVGFPLPEEVTILSAALLAFMGAHPELYPPPYVGAPVVNMHEVALVAFFAVIFSDTLIYTIGRVYGRKVVRHRRLSKLFPEHRLEKVEKWTKKYGMIAVAIFRVTPGIRFPGHLACGILQLPLWKFLFIDSIIAGLTIPTQIYLIAIHGEAIFGTLKKFKLIILALFVILFCYFLFKKWQEYKQNNK